MSNKRYTEKHICNCGKLMEYEGVETSIISDIDENNEMLSDLDVYICNNCGYKICIFYTMSHTQMKYFEKIYRI